MKALILSTNDIKGGAARASYRLHQGLHKIGVDSLMLVQQKHCDSATVIGSSVESGIAKARTGLKLTIERLPLKLYGNRKNTPYSLQWLPDNLTSKVAQYKPDLINLHFIGEGYLKIETIANFNRPMVWTLHDSWAFTGGCHIPYDCKRYTESCGSCPQLYSNSNWDLSRWVWQRKNKAWSKANLTIVTPSQWLAESAKASSLFKNFRVEVIPHGLDLTLYRPHQRNVAREILGLPQEKLLVLFGAINSTSDRNKGFHLLQTALEKLSQSIPHSELELVIFGASQPEKPLDIRFKTHYLGKLADSTSLSLIYSAADVMVVPSIQESFGQTAFESLACATPVVAFNATGLRDIVDHQYNGYLAQPYEAEDLARGIIWILENQERHHKLSFNARQKAENEYDHKIQAHRYFSLFTEIVNNCQSHIQMN